MTDKQLQSKSLTEYRILVRGEIPGKIWDRLSAVHAQAILKSWNKAVIDSSSQKELQNVGEELISQPRRQISLQRNRRQSKQEGG